MIFDIHTRDQLEARGREGSEVTDLGDYVMSRVLDSYYVAIDKQDHGLMPHIYDGYWESWIMLWILRNVEVNSRTADLGANVGFYTYLLQEMNCSVDAFEPNPEIKRLLSLGGIEKVSAGKLNLFNLAVSNVNKTLDFIVPRHNFMNGSLHKSVNSPDGEDIIQVQAIDKLNPYDFIKIDVEGAELEIFDILNPAQHPLVLMEFRWDRYPDPYGFAQSIFRKYRVAYVNDDGNELPIDQPEDLLQREHADWMLVLRG